LVEVADRADVVEPFDLQERDAGRVIAAVFEALQSLQKQWMRLPGAHVSDDSAHLEPLFFDRLLRPLRSLLPAKTA
jgi:hypothetical protein